MKVKVIEVVLLYCRGEAVKVIVVLSLYCRGGSSTHVHAYAHTYTQFTPPTLTHVPIPPPTHTHTKQVLLGLVLTPCPLLSCLPQGDPAWGIKNNTWDKKTLVKFVFRRACKMETEDCQYGGGGWGRVGGRVCPDSGGPLIC